MLLVGFASCGSHIKGSRSIVNLHQNKGRIIVEYEKYKVYLDENKVLQYLENNTDRSKKAEEMLLFLKSNNDTLILKRESTTSVIDDDSDYVLDMYVHFLKKGDCAIVEKQNDRYVTEIIVNTIKRGKTLYQVNFSIDDESFFSRPYVFWEP
jgi:hypothetical protein